jgi:hypothetical protein
LAGAVRYSVDRALKDCSEYEREMIAAQVTVQVLRSFGVLRRTASLTSEVVVPSSAAGDRYYRKAATWLLPTSEWRDRIGGGPPAKRDYPPQYVTSSDDPRNAEAVERAQRRDSAEVYREDAVAITADPRLVAEALVADEDATEAERKRLLAAMLTAAIDVETGRSSIEKQHDKSLIARSLGISNGTLMNWAMQGRRLWTSRYPDWRQLLARYREVAQTSGFTEVRQATPTWPALSPPASPEARLRS